MPRLRRVDCAGPGLRRRRRGRGFEYLDANGNRIKDSETLARLKALVIPPAWEEVWICPHPYGHLQAVGRDDAGRRQYLYHEDWRTRMDQKKFDHMLEFAEALPVMRTVALDHLALDDFPRERVLGCAVRLLDRGFFRIGCEGYAEQNQTYGLATIHKEHVTLDGDRVLFNYVAKGGQRRLWSTVDPSVCEVVIGLKRRRSGGPELLAYKEGRRWVDVKSTDINDYIREIAEEDFTAKDFRTWNATVLAAVALAVSTEASSETARKRAISRAVKEVAHYLGNTPAVSRASYIDPRVFDRYRSGWTIAGALDEIGEGAGFGELATQGAIEDAVRDLLENRRSSDAVEKVA
jgi:DNA topoisomerase I